MKLGESGSGKGLYFLCSGVFGGVGLGSWEAGSVLGFGLLHLCSGAEQHFESLALSLCSLINNSERIFPWMALLYVNIAFLAGMYRPCCQIQIHRHYIIPNAVLTSKASYRSTSSLARFPLSPYFSDRTEAFSTHWQPWEAAV